MPQALDDEQDRAIDNLLDSMRTRLNRGVLVVLGRGPLRIEQLAATCRCGCDQLEEALLELESRHLIVRESDGSGSRVRLSEQTTVRDKDRDRVSLTVVDPDGSFVRIVTPRSA